MTWTHEDLYGRHILTNILTLPLSSTDVMERGTVKMVQMSHQHALIVTVVQGHISVVMVIVQHRPPSVMVWMTVEMVLMKRIVTYHVLTWNSSASPMAAVCWMRGSVMEMRTAKITVMKLQKYAVSFWITTHNYLLLKWIKYFQKQLLLDQASFSIHMQHWIYYQTDFYQTLYGSWILNFVNIFIVLIYSGLF